MPDLMKALGVHRNTLHRLGRRLGQLSKRGCAESKKVIPTTRNYLSSWLDTLIVRSLAVAHKLLHQRRVPKLRLLQLEAFGEIATQVFKFPCA